MPTIDKDALKQKYAEERAKRLRPDGNDQYLRIEGRFDHYLDDPYTPRVERAPKSAVTATAAIVAVRARILPRRVATDMRPP